MPFRFIAPRFRLSLVCPFVSLLRDLGYPGYALSCHCSEILAILIMPFRFIAPKYFWIIWLSNLTILGVPDIGIPETRGAHKIWFILFLLLSLGRYFCWWTISYWDITRTVVIVSALTWDVTYIVYLLLKFTVPK